MVERVAAVVLPEVNLQVAREHIAGVYEIDWHRQSVLHYKTPDHCIHSSISRGPGNQLESGVSPGLHILVSQSIDGDVPH